MCQQCQGFDDDSEALAAAFYSSYGKAVPAVKPAPQNHALVNSKAVPLAAAAKKVAR